MHLPNPEAPDISGGASNEEYLTNGFSLSTSCSHLVPSLPAAPRKFFTSTFFATLACE